MRRPWPFPVLDLAMDRGHLRITLVRGAAASDELMTLLYLAGGAPGGLAGEYCEGMESWFLPPDCTPLVESALNDLYTYFPALTSVAPSRAFRWIERLAIAIPWSVRQRVLRPALEDLVIDRVEALGRFSGRWERRWVRLVFTLRALFCLLNTARVGCIAFAARALPARLWRWWSA